VVGADPGAVYAVLADLSSRPAWLAELRRVDAPPGPAAVGTRFTGESSLLFHDFAGVSEVVTAEPGRELAEEVLLGARMVSRWTLENDGATRTRVTHVIEIDFPTGPLGRLERWVLRRRLAQLQRRSLAGLGDVVGGAGA
jgi:hypothetical protein